MTEPSIPKKGLEQLLTELGELFPKMQEMWGHINTPTWNRSGALKYLTLNDFDPLEKTFRQIGKELDALGVVPEFHRHATHILSSGAPSYDKTLGLTMRVFTANPGMTTYCLDHSRDGIRQIRVDGFNNLAAAIIAKNPKPIAPEFLIMPAAPKAEPAVAAAQATEGAYKKWVNNLNKPQRLVFGAVQAVAGGAFITWGINDFMQLKEKSDKDKNWTKLKGIAKLVAGGGLIALGIQTGRMSPSR